MPPKAAQRSQPPAAAPQAGADLGVLRDVLGFRFRRIQNHLSTTFRDRLAGRDLKPGEFSALALISANPGISQIELARLGGFDKTSVVMLIDDLERWGWAVRERSTADRRRVSLSVTPKGDDMLAELVEIARDTEASIAKALSAAELRRLYETLDRIYDLCFDDETS